MKSPVVCLREIETVGNIYRVLDSCSHNGFPVVTTEAKNLVGNRQRCWLLAAGCWLAVGCWLMGDCWLIGDCCGVGLATRNQLVVLLNKVLQHTYIHIWWFATHL